MREEDLRVLRTLQQKMRIRQGEEVPLSEVMHRVLAVGLEHEEEIVGEDAGPDLTEEGIEEIMDLSWDFGIDDEPRDHR